MRAVAHSAPFAKKVGIPQNVGMDFAAADAAKKGTAMARKTAPFMGKESAQEETKEKKKFPGKKAYAKAEAKYEGEKYACGGKVKRRYAEGGDVIEGQNENIDDDVRARARRFVDSGTTDDDSKERASSKSSTRQSRSRNTPEKSDATGSRQSVGTPAGTGAALRASGSSKQFSRIPGPSDDSTAAKAVKTYEDPSDDPYAGLKEAGKAAAMMAGPEATMAGMRAARAASAAVKAAGKPTTQAVGEIGTKVRPSVDEAMFSRTSEVADRAKSLAENAKRIAPKRAMEGTSRKGKLENPADAVRKSRADTAEARNKAMRDRSPDDMYACGGKVKAKKMASGGSVRGVGIAKRGFGRGIMR